MQRMWKRCLKTINLWSKKFPNIYCNGDINKFVLLLRKGVYPYEHMDSWEKFDETSLPDKSFLQWIVSKRYYW